MTANDTLLAFDQQFQIQVAMVLNGAMPQGGASLTFIIKTLKRHNYDPERLAVMENIAPLVRDEIQYLETKATCERLEASRPSRLEKLRKLMR